LDGFRTKATEALIDTGADLSLFDEGLAQDLGLDLQSLPAVNLSGVGGLLREARLAEVRLTLLDLAELQVTLEVAFAPEVELAHGNLIGLDVLEHFDFALAHADRLGYLGRR
jgi:predicted aspartyl protease